jgi:hypothetical protein
MATAAHNPDLRPLSLSELLDRTFTYYRRNFWLFVGIMAIPQLFVVAMSILFEEVQQLGRAGPAATGIDWLTPQVIIGFAVGFILFLTVFSVVYLFAQGATALAVSDVHLGRAATIRGSYQEMKRHLWRLFLLINAICLRLAGVAMLFIGGIAAIAVAVGLVSSNGLAGALGIFLGILAILASIVLFFLLGLRYSLATPALLLEDLKAGEAIRRSVFLARGNLGRIFLMSFLMSMVSWTASAICQGPFMVLAAVLAIKSRGVVPMWVSVPGDVAAGVGRALGAPLLMIGLALIYYDARVRKEGFDLQQMLESIEQQGAKPNQP